MFGLRTSSWYQTRSRVPVLPIRDCAGSCNNRGPMRLKLSAIDVTAKAIFERWYLVLGLRKFAPWVNCPYAPTRSAKSKRQALGNYFSEQICYMFLISKCKRDWDLGLSTFWELAKREPLRNAKFRFFLRTKHVCFRKSPLLMIHGCRVTASTTGTSRILSGTFTPEPRRWQN